MGFYGSEKDEMTVGKQIFFVLYVFVWPDIWTEETFFDESCIQYVSIDHKCPTFGYIYTTRNIVFPSKLQESTVAN